MMNFLLLKILAKVNNRRLQKLIIGGDYLYLIATLDIILIISSVIGYKLFDLPLKLTIAWIAAGLTSLYFCHKTLILMAFNNF